MTTTTMNLRAWALHFAARGWHVVPITPQAKKPPAITQWETRASTDPDRIHSWWRHTPYGVGIATGPSGLVVIDLDTLKPGETVPERWAAVGISSGTGVLRALAAEHGSAVAPTWAVTTPSGGWHLYYTTPLIDDRDPVPLPTWLHHALTPKAPMGLSAPALTATTNPSGYVVAAAAG
jgi:hypothetical protein